jgi:rRNA maturation protein Nop10
VALINVAKNNMAAGRFIFHLENHSNKTTKETSIMLCPNCNSYQHETKKADHCQVCGFNFAVEVPTVYKYRIDRLYPYAQVFVEYGLKKEVNKLIREIITRVPQGSDNHVLLETMLYNVMQAATVAEISDAVKDARITITTL